jgi:DNA-binding GntR family transcriptional regulator
MERRMAKYNDIADALRRMIRNKQAGEGLPSDRALAARFGVSSGAVRMANDTHPE